jgi:NifU-like protein involved in Fe-S cluster formation
MQDEATGAHAEHAEIVRDLDKDVRKPPRKGRRGPDNEDTDQIRYELFLDPLGHRIQGVQFDVYGSPTVLATAAAVGELAMHATVPEARQRLRKRRGAHRPSVPLDRPLDRDDRELTCCLRAMRAALRAATDAAARVRDRTEADTAQRSRVGAPLARPQPTAG